VAIYANNGGAEFALPIRPQMAQNARWQFVLLYTAPAEAKARAVEDVSAAILDNAIAIGEHAGLPIHHFPLDRAGEAHAAVQNGAVGKVLVDVADN
jgi:NADPH2:quinone reductase